MGLAIQQMRSPARRMSSFNSLFVGMGLAMIIYLLHVDARTVSCFNSLFVGMGLAIE